MITSLTIQNFRTLRNISIQFPFGKPLVLIGPNGSGKSSVLEVLDLLATAVEYQDGLDRAINQARWGFQSVRTAGQTSPFSVTVDFTVDENRVLRTGKFHAKYQFALQELQGGRFCVSEESLRVDRQGGLSGQLLSRRGDQVKLVNESTHAEDPSMAGDTQLSLATMLQTSFYPTLAATREALARCRVYLGFVTAPPWARDERIENTSPRNPQIISQMDRLDRRGVDLVNALYYLQQNHDLPWRRLETAFKAEFPDVERLEFPPAPGQGHIILGYRDRRFPGARFFASQMSEGMIAYLSILCSLLVPDSPVAVAFDEPDLHLHPSLLRRVVDAIETRAERTSVLVATHSDRLLDYLSDPAASVRVCEKQAEGTEIRELNSAALDAWLEKYTLSELRRQGQLDPTNQDAD